MSPENARAHVRAELERGDQALRAAPELPEGAAEGIVAADRFCSAGRKVLASGGWTDA